MIAFRIEITTSAPLFEEDGNSAYGGAKRKFIEKQNNGLLNLFEENGLLLAQIVDMDTPFALLIYAAYTPLVAEKGKIEGEADILELWKRLPVTAPVTRCSVEEISVTEFNRARDRFEMFQYNSRARELLKKQLFLVSNLRDPYGYHMSDRLASDDAAATKADAVSAAQKLLPDATIMEELDRIFCDTHPTQFFYGIPVHYKITAKSDRIADEIVDLITACLYRNKRVLSRRITKIDCIESGRIEQSEILDLFKCSQDSVMEIVLSGDVATEQEYASEYHHTADLLAEYIKKYSGSVQFFFVENAGHPGFAKQLLGKIDDELDIIDLREGVGDAGRATAFFRELLAESNMQSFFEEEEVVFQPEKFYSATEVCTRFNQWRKEKLKSRVYNAYHRSQAVRIEKSLRSRGSAFDELQRMVGLTSVKTIITDIISSYKVQKLRSQYYDSREAVTRHMIFTGNPGTAKTTVARLLAEILKENGILRTGAFVECGRASLVGMYVGWTARLVKEKFKQAQGGILFIDEAYSLVEERNGSYGDEAINTIVQEMENMRGDVIVIFAGYPEKMKSFLAKNEGLRSRIAFHVDFLDYTAEELMGILDKILEEKQYHMTPQAKSRAWQIFRQACVQAEYGNGRFVRNLFEQALNRQATRISELGEGEIDREGLFELQASDLDVNIVKQYDRPQKKLIGFAG